MNNITKLIFIPVLVAGFFQLAQAQSSYNVKGSGGANFRQGPGKEKSVISTIPAGTKLTVIEKNDDWYKVEYNGKTGYVSASLLEEDRKSENKEKRNESANTTQNNENKSNNNSGSHTSNQSSKNKKSSQKKSGNNSSGSSSYNWGIGLRFGDPLGITVKKYKNTAAWEFNLGRSARWGYHYSDKDFYRYNKYDDRDLYHYAGHVPGSTTALQIHYLLHKPINGAEGLKFYYGGGAQFRFTPVTYRYYHNRYDNGSEWWKDWYYTEERRTDIDLGIDGTLGLEYTFKDAPVSIFLDGNLFIELVNTPFLFSGQGGIGVRYNF
jgi:hypothetical protein